MSESTKVVKNGMYSIDRLIDRYVEAVDRLSENPQLNRLLSEYSDDQPQLTEGLVAEIFQNMYQVLQTFHSTSDIHLLHSGSKAALSLRDLPSIYDLPANSDWGAFYSANHSQETIVKPSLYTNSRHTVMAVTVMRAIRAQGSILGYVAMDIPLEVIRNELIGSHQLLPINFTLMSKFNYALFNDAALPSYAQFISWKGRELTKKAGYVVEPVDDYHLLIPFFPSEKYNLVLLGSINIDLLLGRFSVVSSILLIMALTSLAFFAVISLLVTKRITQPLQTIVTSMHGIEEGNFDQRVLLPQEDEFGYLAAQFNVMCEKIKDLFQKDREKQESLRVAELKTYKRRLTLIFYVTPWTR
ncbi:MAG: HAMP domain-containing protein [Angelakisella sp.]